MPSDYSEVPAATTKLAMPARASTPPPILRRGTKTRRRKDSLNPVEEEVIVSLPVLVSGDIKQEQVFEDGDEMDQFMNSPAKYGTTPIKQLPFSPSQFLNSPNLTFDVQLASTPVRHSVQPSTPQKEKSKAVRRRITLI